MDELENNYRVRLIPISSLINGSSYDVIAQSQVAFDVTPSFTETGTVEYTPVTPVHMPGSIQVYKHTNSRAFEITAHFVSRNIIDARKNMDYLQRLRSWRYPYFGLTSTLTQDQSSRRQAQGTTYGDLRQLTPEQRDAKVRERVQNEGVQLRGAPPDVLYLYAYSTSGNDKRNADPTRVNINRVPVVLTSLTITYPEDVDYIPVFSSDENGPDAQTEPFPVKIDVNISLAETHSPKEFESFDLKAYKTGRLVNF